MLGHLLAVPALVAPSQPAPGRAAAAGGSSFWSDAWTNAQLQGSSWRLKLDVGREEGTQMPEEWSASGARLPLSLEVCFTGDPVSGGALRWSVEEPSCCPAKRLLVTSAATLVGADGEVSVAVGAGGWLAEPEDRCGRSTLRFYLDFPDGAERNGASIPAGRVFFNAACWDGAVLSRYEAEAEVVRAELSGSAAADAGGATRDAGGVSLVKLAQAVLPSERRQTLE